MDTQHFLGKLFVLSGPSGVGKNTVLDRLLQKNPSIRRVPTFTTRSPRLGEIEGREHFFVGVDTFHKLIRTGRLVEYQEVYPGRYYGVPREETESMLRQWRVLIAEVDILGAQSLRQAFPANTTLIFLAPPSKEDLLERLRSRGNMLEEDVEERLSRLALEMEKSILADYIIHNDILDDCVTEIAGIIEREAYVGDETPPIF